MKHVLTFDDRLAVQEALIAAEFGLADAAILAADDPAVRKSAKKRLATVHAAMELIEISPCFDAEGIWLTRETAA